MTIILPPGYQDLRLPANYTIRSPLEGDIQAIIDLVYDHDMAAVGEADRYTPDDIRVDWERMNPETDAWCILSPEGTLAAYGLFWSHDVAAYGRYGADGYVHPAHQGHGLGAMLLDLTEARSAEVMQTQPEGTRQVLVNNIIASSAAARALFESRDYTLTRVYFLMQIAFDETLELPRWPEGISVRACNGSPEDIRQAYETIEEGFQDHWAHTPRSFEEWQQKMVREHFDPTLWFLAMDGNEVAGAALCQVRDPEAGFGWITQVAVRQPWRKRGLASALLHHAFHTFSQRGLKRAGLGVDGQSLTGAQRLYERVGMHVTMRIGRYEKELRAGRELHPGQVS